VRAQFVEEREKGAGLAAGLAVGLAVGVAVQGGSVGRECRRTECKSDERLLPGGKLNTDASVVPLIKPAWKEFFRRLILHHAVNSNLGNFPGVK
jgi:hypothetical protein